MSDEFDIEAWYNAELSALNRRTSARLEAGADFTEVEGAHHIELRRLVHNRNQSLAQVEKDKRNVVKRARRALRRARGQ